MRVWRKILCIGGKVELSLRQNITCIILLSFLRLVLFAFVTLWFMGIIALRSFVRGFDIRHALSVRRRWANFLLPRLGLRVHKTGEPPNFPCIIMGNHRAYLDPALILMHTEAFPVSKAEVERWPIIGKGASMTGIVFLKRESIASRKITLQAIADKVREGYPVILFPEGTTHALPTTGDFKPGSFNLAAKEGIPIVPVAIEYDTPEAYWIGDATFLPHFLRYFARKTNRVNLCYGPVFQDTDSRALQVAVKAWIDEQLDGKLRIYD